MLIFLSSLWVSNLLVPSGVSCHLFFRLWYTDFRLHFLACHRDSYLTLFATGLVNGNTWCSRCVSYFRWTCCWYCLWCQCTSTICRRSATVWRPFCMQCTFVLNIASFWRYQHLMEHMLFCICTFLALLCPHVKCMFVRLTWSFVLLLRLCSKAYLYLK